MYTQTPHTHTYIKYMVYMYKGVLPLRICHHTSLIHITIIYIYSYMKCKALKNKGNCTLSENEK